MTLTVLGSGTMMPTRERFPSSYLVTSGEARLLLDCGFLTIARLLEYGISLHDITAVCLTHFHTDHFGHVFPLVHARWVDDRIAGRAHRTLPILGPGTLQERWTKLKSVFWPEPEEAYPVELREGPLRDRLGPFDVESFPVTHVSWFPSVGYRIEADGGTLVYTGDIGSAHPFADLVARVRGADVLIIEAGAERSVSTHFTLENIFALQEAVQVRTIFVTHLREERVPTLTARLAGRSDIRIATDGLTVDI